MPIVGQVLFGLDIKQGNFMLSSSLPEINVTTLTRLINFRWALRKSSEKGMSDLTLD